jgi:hypothetical protein
MKQQVSPAVAAIAIVVVCVLAVFAYWQFGGGRYTGEKPPPTMPPSVAQEWNKYTKGAGAAPGSPSGPGGASVPGATSIPGAGPTSK